MIGRNIQHIGHVFETKLGYGSDMEKSKSEDSNRK